MVTKVVAGAASASDDQAQELTKYQACVRDLTAVLDSLGIPEGSIGIIYEQAILLLLGIDQYHSKLPPSYSIVFKFDEDRDGNSNGGIRLRIPGFDSIKFLKGENCAKDIAIPAIDPGTLDEYFAIATLDDVFTSDGNPGTLSWYTTAQKFIVIFTFGDYTIVLNNPVY